MEMETGNLALKIEAADYGAKHVCFEGVFIIL